MIAMRRLVCEVGSGIDPGEGAEIVDEMGLIEIAAGQRHCGPIHVAAQSDAVQNVLEALDAAEQFRRQANLIIENIDKAAGAETDPAGDFGDGWSAAARVSKFL